MSFLPIITIFVQNDIKYLFSQRAEIEELVLVLTGFLKELSDKINRDIRFMKNTVTIGKNDVKYLFWSACWKIGK